MNLILIPSDYEAAPLIQRLNARKTHRFSSRLSLYEGRCDGNPVAIGIIGMGACAGKRAAQAFDVIHPSRAILAGFCGALAESLDIGDIFLTTPQISGDPVPWRSALLYTSQTLIDTTEAREALFKQTKADCVDMEQSHIAAAAQARDIPLVGVRIVSDTVETDIPRQALAHAYNYVKGKTTPLRMGLYLLTHPRDIKRLTAFLRPLNPVREKLAEEIVEYLVSLNQNAATAILDD